MIALLRNKNWASFALKYNGPAYKTNKYDEKLARAYAKYFK
ncbi:N-acetylmuramidase domain-containing protein [Flavobacterium procerum]|uniref:N-acetylmuramidase domain-containing protein n=1 Tax=Flavobacterium procerum TaxID=1455569 RepID=A0ABV6BVK3_9FLAO